MNPFSYENRLLNEHSRLVKETETYSRFEVSFKSAIDTGYGRNTNVLGDYYLPKTEGPFPLAVLVHGMGDPSVIPFRFMARNFVKKGIACFLPYLTIHSKRIPRPIKEHMPYLSPEEWFNVYRQSVVDVQQVFDWAESKPEINSNKLFLAGISFGGFVSSIVMGLDDRVKAGIFIVTGGNSNKLSWLNKEGQYRKRFRRSESEHFAVMEQYRQYLEEVDTVGFENAVTNNLSFLTDPLTFAPKLRNRPILMINARQDKYIPPECAKDLWEAIGKPDIHWYPSGHVTLWFWYRSIRKKMSDFFGMFLQ